MTVFNFTHPPVLSALLLILYASRFLIPDFPLLVSVPSLSSAPLHGMTLRLPLRNKPSLDSFNHHHHHLSLNREGRWGTTDDFAFSFLHFPLFSTALWDLPNSRPVYSLMLSANWLLASCNLPFFFQTSTRRMKSQTGPHDLLKLRTYFCHQSTHLHFRWPDFEKWGLLKLGPYMSSSSEKLCVNMEHGHALVHTHTHKAITFVIMPIWNLYDFVFFSFFLIWKC